MFDRLRKHLGARRELDPPRPDEPLSAARAMDFPVRVHWNADAAGPSGTPLSLREQQLRARVEQQIAERQYELPNLSKTALRVIRLAADAVVDVATMVETLEADRHLAREVLAVSNSAAFGGLKDSDNLTDAVMRLGMRGVRSIVLTISMRGAILRDKSMTRYASQVWRQALSTAHIARLLSGPAGMDPERGYLLGLVHDVGKVVLLGVLARESRATFSSAFVGVVLAGMHERLGGEMACHWSLPAQVASVSGRHHPFHANKAHTRQAALVSLAHRADLYLSQAARDDFWALEGSEEMDLLGIPRPVRRALLESVLRHALEAEENGLAA